MNESYCIKDKKVTPCVDPSGYQTDKNGSLKGEGLMTDVGGIAADALYHYGLPWLGKKHLKWGDMELVN